MKPTFALTLALFTTSLAGVAAQNPPPLLAQQPALSATHIVFVFAGDLWSVLRQGGGAMRLTTGVGVESNPSFSPDGRWITFTGQYDGNTDVFVMPAEGGVPKRLTWHPDEDIALGWTTDGKRILFSSSRNSSTRTRELYLAGLEGGLEEKLPLPMGWEASYSPDGERLAYVPTNRAFFMMGEITVGHLGVGGGDMPGTRNIPTGLLGAAYRIENARYRFARMWAAPGRRR